MFEPYEYSNTQLGNIAENAVEDMLLSQNWVILARNYRGRSFEIDIIAQKPPTTVFIEVKLRKSNQLHFDSFEELLPKRKRIALKRGAMHFLSSQTYWREKASTMRFDLAVCIPFSNNKKRKIPDHFTIRYFPEIFCWESF